MPPAENPTEQLDNMSAPHAGEIPNLNLLLGGFADWGVAKWATVQDIVVRFSIAIDITEAELLAKQLLHNRYIEAAYKNGREYEYVEPGRSGTQIGYEKLPGYALTRSGRQFHLDGGYRLDQIRPLAKHAATPAINPESHGTKKRTAFLAGVDWVKQHPISLLFIGVTTYVVGVFVPSWIDKNWDGKLTIESMRSLFGILP